MSRAGAKMALTCLNKRFEQKLAPITEDLEREARLCLGRECLMMFSKILLVFIISLNIINAESGVDILEKSIFVTKKIKPLETHYYKIPDILNDKYEVNDFDVNNIENAMIVTAYFLYKDDFTTLNNLADDSFLSEGFTNVIGQGTRTRVDETKFVGHVKTDQVDLYLELFNFFEPNTYTLTFQKNKKVIVPIIMNDMVIVMPAESKEKIIELPSIHRIKKTRQKQSFYNGRPVDDGSSKDDGYYEIGVEPKYVRKQNSVIDYVTGLQWQDNEDVKVSRVWIGRNAPSYYRYPDIATEPDSPMQYCESLELDGYDDWRLPDIEELITLADYGQKISINPIFHNHSEYYSYWSSTTDPYYETTHRNAYKYLSYSGTVISNEKGGSGETRCVRGNKASAKIYKRNNESNIVTDVTTGLDWQDTEFNAQSIEMNRDEAIEYCENLVLGSYNDWRLPNINELKSIISFSKSNRAFDSVFTYTDFEKYHRWTYYMSSTIYKYYWPQEYFDYERQNLVIDKRSRRVDHVSDDCYVKCVRGTAK